ncbi:MAG: hypothetical protein V1493_04735, partial [Candidatus Diapherotrites archaeon]
NILITDNFSKVKSPLHPLSPKQARAFNQTPMQAFERLFKRTVPSEYKSTLGLAYICTLYKAAEGQMARICRNFRENAITLLSERGIKADEKIVDELIDYNRGSIREGMLESQEKTLRAFERAYRWELYAKRIREADLRETVNTAVREAAKSMALSKSNPEHWAAMKRATEGLRRTVEGDVKRANENMAYVRERKHKRKSEKEMFVTLGQFIMITAKSTGNMESYVEAARSRIEGELRTLERTKRAAEISKAPSSQKAVDVEISREEMRRRQQARHEEAEREKAGAERTAEGAEAAKKRIARPISPFKENMLKLRKRDRPVHLFILEQYRRRILSKDLALRAAADPHVSLRVGFALKKGFVETLGIEATPALIYTLSLIQGRYIPIDEFNKWVANAPFEKKLKDTAVEFLLKEKILQTFHRGTEISYAKPGKTKW